MSGDATGPRHAVPVPPAVTRSVRDPGIPGGLVPPFVPRWSSRSRQAQPSAAAGQAPPAPSTPQPPPPSRRPSHPRNAPRAVRDDLLEDTDRWPDLPELGSAAPAWGDVDTADIHSEAASAAERGVLAERVADRLEAMARTLREHGLGGLGRAAREDELARLIAGVVAGFYGREEDR